MPEFKIYLMNTYQEQELKQHMPAILSFLRSRLLHSGVKCVVEIDETKVEKVAYTPKEKFDRMAQINPNVIEMVQTFDFQFS